MAAPTFERIMQKKNELQKHFHKDRLGRTIVSGNGGDYVIVIDGKRELNARLMFAKSIYSSAKSVYVVDLQDNTRLKRVKPNELVVFSDQFIANHKNRPMLGV